MKKTQQIVIEFGSKCMVKSYKDAENPLQQQQQLYEKYKTILTCVLGKD